MATTQRAYREIRVALPPHAVDAVCDFIVANIAGGMLLEEEEDSPYTAVVFYVNEDDTDSSELLTEYLQSLVGESLEELPEIEERRVENIAWLQAYRASVQPIEVGDDVVIRPPWSPKPSVNYDIIIEPKMAFGAGSHGTTLGCLKAVRDCFCEGSRLLDMGCGSGILSILAAKMGASYIKAVDYDPEATTNCRENLVLNEVNTPCDVLDGSIEQCDSDSPYEFVCANIIRSTILDMLDRLLALTGSGGMLVLSGLLPEDEGEISEALKKCGQNSFTVSRIENWLTYRIAKS